MPNAQALLEKIQALPPARIAEIEDFVECSGTTRINLQPVENMPMHLENFIYQTNK